MAGSYPENNRSQPRSPVEKVEIDGSVMASGARRGPRHNMVGWQFLAIIGVIIPLAAVVRRLHENAGLATGHGRNIPCAIACAHQPMLQRPHAWRWYRV